MDLITLLIILIIVVITYECKLRVLQKEINKIIKEYEEVDIELQESLVKLNELENKINKHNWMCGNSNTVRIRNKNHKMLMKFREEI